MNDQIFIDGSQAFMRETALVTLPDRMQRVQTLILRTLPSACSTRTFCKLGSHLRLVWTRDPLILLPVIGFLPQTWHTLAIFYLHPSIFFVWQTDLIYHRD